MKWSVGFLCWGWVTLLCDMMGAIGSCAFQVVLVWHSFHHQDRSCTTPVADVIPRTWVSGDPLVTWLHWLEQLQSFQFSVEHRSSVLALQSVEWLQLLWTGRTSERKKLLGQKAFTAPTCCMLQVVDAAKWSACQEGYEDLRPVREWAQKPP